MKGRLKIIIILFVITVIIGGLLIFRFSHKKSDLLDDLININKLDEEFMTEYYSNMKELLKSDNRSNVLIIVSKNRPDDVYGAKRVVSAPNSIYYLEYDSEKDRQKAKEKLEKNKKIYSVVENRKYTFSDDDSSEISYNSWGIEKSGLNRAIDYINKNGGEDVTVAIIDTGCDMDLFNTSYNGKIEEVYNLYDSDIYGNNIMFDHYGHGTHIAGTIAEGTPDNVKILPVKVSDSNSLDDLDILSAVTYITDNHKADVINMSFGGPSYNAEIDPKYIVIEAARREKIISVAAAGNSNSDVLEVPAAFDNTISISAVDSELNKADFSSYNDSVTFSAPGVDILSINGIKSGTSMATPHAVCAVAFLKSIRKNLTLEQVIDALKQNVVDLGAKGKDRFFGYGFIDLNNFSLCDETNQESCTVLGENSDFTPKGIEVEEVITTPYNYGSITNIMPTKIKISGDNDHYKIVSIDKLDDVIISGYNPYYDGEQTVSLNYLDFNVSFKVTNPENYESGWTYQLDYDEKGQPKDEYVISGYKDNNMEIEKLYFPEKIDNHIVSSIQYMDMNMPYVFGNSNDAKYYKEIYLPSNIKLIGYSIFKNMKNLYKVKSYADEIEIGGSAFEGLKFLTIVDANVLISGSSNGIFSGDISLKEIKISSNSTIIPASAFYGCKFLSSIDLPENISEIQDYAFYSSGIKKITLPNSLQKVGYKAFSDTQLEEVFIPSLVNEIGESAFSGRKLNKIIVSDNNSVYDSRENCNSIIESSTNTLVIGSNKSTIPSDIKVIAPGAFFQSYIKNVDLPDGLEAIGERAFSECYVLDTIKIPNSVNSISDNSFIPYGYYKPFGTKFYVYSSSYAHNYVEKNHRAYVLMDENPNPPSIKNVIFSGKLEYLPYETLDISSYEAIIQYEGIDEDETIKEFRNPTYKDGRDSFRYGDWDAKLYFDTAQGYYNLEMGIPVEIGKLTPEYEIPTNVYANINSTLADVDLPSGFEWKDSTILLTELGDKVYDARYIPTDENYKIIEDIAIPVHVIDKTLIKPNITVADKIYDGTLSLSTDSITITDIDQNDYEIVSATVDDSNAGLRNALVKLRLTDEKFESYAFSNGLQEKEFRCSINILPERLKRPTLVDKKYVYNGNYQYASINDYNNKKMSITGNKQKGAGTYWINISLKNENYTNYIWDDGFSYTLSLPFVIEQSEITYYSWNQEVLYDGEEHGIELYVDNNSIIKYMDDHGNYTLNKMPMYTEPGTYTIKYMITIDENYKPAYGENTLTIKNNEIINNSKDYEGVYDGNFHSISLSVEPSNYTIKYSVDNTNYDLDELPTFKDVGLYTINYKISVDGYDDLEGSNQVKIYGIKKIDDSIKNKDNMLVAEDNSFNNLSNKITTYSTSTLYTHYNKNNELIDENIIKTGDIIKININNNNIYEYKIVYLGDTSGDGKINYLDYVNVYNHIQKLKNSESNKNLLTDEYLIAADMSGDNKISYLDYVKIYNKIKELKGDN